MRKKRPIVYYVSAHGYGHGVRTCDILNALYALHPDVPVTIVTDLPETFLKNRLHSPTVSIRRGAFDVGMLQLDSVRVDVPGTLGQLRQLYENRDDLVLEEALFLRKQQAAIAVSDIAAIPIEAAKKCGTTALAVGNFAWDWIYSEFQDSDPRWGDVIEQFSESYAKTDLLLRLPFAEEMAAFPRKEDIPIVAQAGRQRRADIAELTGARPDRNWVLLSFSSLDLADEALERIAGIAGHEFFTVKPLAWNQPNIHAIDREKVPFSDVLASADVVVSKPGFGLVSECIVNRKPLIYVDRTEFLEYPILVRGIQHHLRNVEIKQQQLYAGELAEALTTIWEQPDPDRTMPCGGGRYAAQRIMDFYPLR